MIRNLYIIFFCFSVNLYAQKLLTPLEANNFGSLTSYDQLAQFVEQLDQQTDLMRSEVIGKSAEGRNLYGLFFSNSDFGMDDSKIKLLIFAQQHGNEQSGKEGALMLAQRLTEPEYQFLFERIDLVIIPQLNPDGSELNKRRNGNDVDLNRNHLILTEPETMALHRLFNRYLFEVTMDVHEYYPYLESWKKYGYRKNPDVAIGTLTNINVSGKIRTFASEKYLPYILKYLSDRDFTSFEYCPGGPPEETYIRHSTFDINDGRQSPGIQNTLSFIQEGKNGEDGYIQNIRRRAQGQMTGMMGLIEFVHHHPKKIKKLITAERKKLITGTDKKTVSIQMEHTGNKKSLNLPVFAYYSNSDSMVIAEDYRPVVKELTSVLKPEGYLIPVQHQEVVDWIKRANISSGKIESMNDYLIEQYFVTLIDSIDFEGDIIVNPITETKNLQGFKDTDKYIFVSASQLKGNLIIQALEPKSMLGLATYKEFEHLLKSGEIFPILRVVKKHSP